MRQRLRFYLGDELREIGDVSGHYRIRETYVLLFHINGLLQTFAVGAFNSYDFYFLLTFCCLCIGRQADGCT